MIYTVTLNPSLDYVADVTDFRAGIVNRTEREKLLAGGKGINVSVVLRNLGYESTALGFTAGFTGAEIERMLREQGVRTDFIPVAEGFSRINVKLRNHQGNSIGASAGERSGMMEAGRSTESRGRAEFVNGPFKRGAKSGSSPSEACTESEINGQGPRISGGELSALYDRLDRLEKGDILVLAGSIPGTMPASVYSEILKRMQEKELNTVVDATKDLLLPVLSYCPFLVKPNHHELGEIFGVCIQTREEALLYAGRLQKMGACNVLVSMAGEGAVLVTEDGQQFSAAAPQGVVVNSVGAGDSMVAGFLAGYLNSRDYAEAFRMGVCAGSASAFSEELATREEVFALLKRDQNLF